MEQMGLQAAAYSTAIYCRLSRDDTPSRHGSVDAESASIGTQKMMLEKYCREQGYSIYDVYADDGYSGLNYNRPDFSRLLADIDNGKVNLIVTKDLSRLGRDYIQTGYYIEMHFSKKKIRYIAVNDNIDTMRQDNDITPFRNILNDLYAKDLSRKVKSAKRQRAYNGYFISAQAPYGYKVDPTDKNRLAIDETAAKVVREIYRLASAGHSTAQITSILTERKTPTPSVYKAQNGDTRFLRQLESSGEHHWCRGTVHNILRDRVYVGDMENHKYEVVNYKTKEIRAVPKDQHIIVENTHESIIRRDDWDRVQELVARRNRPNRNDFENVFKNIACCSECGHRLTLAFNYSRAGERTTPYLRCTHRYANPNACQHSHRIHYADLYNQVLKRMQQLAKKVERGTLPETSTKQLVKQKKTDKLNTEKAKINARLSTLTKITKQLYEDNACGILDIDSHRAFLKDYQAEHKRLSERLQTIEDELNQEDDYTGNLQKLCDAIRYYADIRELTANMLNHLVERIEVGHVVEIDGQKQQEVNVIYRFIGAAL